MSGQILEVRMDKEHEKVDFIPTREQQLKGTKGQMLSRRHELLMALMARGWLNHRLGYVYVAVDAVYITTKITGTGFRERVIKKVVRLRQHYLITEQDGVPKAPELVDRWVKFLEAVNVADMQGLGGSPVPTYRDLANILTPRPSLNSDF